ncbi:MAG: response regulator [Spirosoma sp.]|nr:response regulator [Spirosoma sp.]
MPSGFPILVVDEDPTLADTLNQAAQHCFPEASFHQVFTAPQAKTYLERLSNFSVRLVIMAINEQHSPEDLGLLAFLRAHDEAQSLPIFILTTSLLPCDLMAAYTSYADSLTFKPFSLDDWAIYLNKLAQYSNVA